MATFSITLDSNSWQELTQHSTIVYNKSSYVLKIAVDSSLPVTNTENFIPLSAGEHLTLTIEDNQALFAIAEEGKTVNVVYSDNTVTFTDALLQEDGFLLLQEDGSKLLIES